MTIQLEQATGLLKPEGQDTIQRFIGELADPGFNAAILLHIAGHSRLAIAAPHFSRAIEELIKHTKNGTEPEGVVIAAQSFSLVTGLLHSFGSLGLPEDFLPSKKLVARCADKYYELKRTL